MYTSCTVAVSVNDQMVFYSREIRDSECMKRALESKNAIYLVPGKHIKNCRHIELHGKYYALTDDHR